MKRLTSYQFWIGIASGGLLIVQWISKYFGVNINPDMYLEIVSGVLSIFVVLGFVVPTKSQGDTSVEHILFTDAQKAQAFKEALQQANITFTTTELKEGTLFSIASQKTDIASVEKTAQDIAQDIKEKAEEMAQGVEAPLAQDTVETAVENIPAAQTAMVESGAENDTILQNQSAEMQGKVVTEYSVQNQENEPETKEDEIASVSMQNAQNMQNEVKNIEICIKNEQNATESVQTNALGCMQENAENAAEVEQKIVCDVEKEAPAINEQQRVKEEILILENANKADEAQIKILQESRELYAQTCIQQLQTCIQNRNQRIAYLKENYSL